jgi:peptide/nickel transport system substrate-binding protein
MEKGTLFQKCNYSKRKLLSMLLIGVLLTVLLISSLVPLNTFSAQPPVDSSTYYVATTSQPSRLDPARANDQMSGELLQNVYQTLIWWSDKHPIAFTPGVGYNLTVADYADPDTYVPVLATEVPTVGNGRIITNASGSYWRFTIHTNGLFDTWEAANGSMIFYHNITAADVVYSFRRQVIYDSIYGPTWMWMTRAFGFESWSSRYGGPYSTYNNGTFVNAADEAAAAAMIQNWCYSIGNDVYFHFQQPSAENIMKQMFAQTWGSVVHPDWVKEMGGWDGLFTAGWTNYYHWKPTKERSELDTYKDPAIYGVKGSKYPSYTTRMVGSGPYRLTIWDTTNKIWRIDYNPIYWMGWFNAGDKEGNFFHTAIWKQVDYWPTRKMQFLDGEFDVAAVPTANMYDLLTSTYNPIPGINLVYNIPLLSSRMIAFNMNVTAYVERMYVGYPTHIFNEPTLFSNVHIRRAFAWALNYSAYIQDAYDGEAIVQRSWWIDGLWPSSFKNENASMPQRTLNYAEMQNELNQAIVDGYNVSETGFDITFMYLQDFYNDQDLIPYKMIAQAFATLNPAKYKLTLIGLPLFDSWNYKDSSMNSCWWPADSTDPDNLCEPFQASWGYIMSGQGPPFPEDQALVDAEILAALVETDPNVRGEMYRDLQYRFWLDVPSIPLVQPVTRRWARDWVQGWYFNALLPGDYLYDLHKTVSPPQDVDVQLSLGPPPPSSGMLAPLQYPRVLFCPQTGRLLIGNGNPAPADQDYSIYIIRADNNVAVPLLSVVVGLQIRDPSGFTFYTSAIIGLAPNTFAALTLWWYGANPGPVYGSQTGVAWMVNAVAFPISPPARFINPAAMYLDTVTIFTLMGDISNNGLVDIFDAIMLAMAYGSDAESRIWNPWADLNGSGNIDIFDAILLANNFNNRAPP